MSSIYPPYENLYRVLEKCPKAALLYLFLWKEKDKDNKLCYRKHEITDQLFFSWKTFRTELRALSKEKALTFHFNLQEDEVLIEIQIPSHTSQKAA